MTATIEELQRVLGRLTDKRAREIIERLIEIEQEELDRPTKDC